MEGEFEFQHFPDKKSFDRRQEIKKRHREAKLKWRASVLKHKHKPVRPTLKSRFLVRYHS